MVAHFAFFKTGDEVPGFDFEFAAYLCLPMPGEAANLSSVREEADVGIEGRDAEFPVFDTAVGAFGFRTPGDGEVVELFPR